MKHYNEWDSNPIVGGWKPEQEPEPEREKRVIVKRKVIGERFGRLVAIKLDRITEGHVQYFLCVCDCGNQKIVQRSALVFGKTKSCGCYRKEVCAKLHSN